MMSKEFMLLRLDKDSDHKLEVLTKLYLKNRSEILDELIRECVEDESIFLENVEHYLYKYLLKDKYFSLQKNFNTTTYNVDMGNVEELKKIFEGELKKKKDIRRIKIRMSKFYRSLIDKKYETGYMGDKETVVNLMNELESKGFEPNNHFVGYDGEIYISFKKSDFLPKNYNKNLK